MECILSYWDYHIGIGFIEREIEQVIWIRYKTLILCLDLYIALCICVRLYMCDLNKNIHVSRSISKCSVWNYTLAPWVRICHTFLEPSKTVCINLARSSQEMHNKICSSNAVKARDVIYGNDSEIKCLIQTLNLGPGFYKGYRENQYVEIVTHTSLG